MRPWRAAAVVPVVAVVAVVGAGVAAPAQASGTYRPAVTIDDVVVDGSSATIKYSINRAARKVASQTCTLNNDPVTCDSVPDSKRWRPVVTRYSVQLGPLADGDYTFAVAFVFKRGGQASTSTDFAVTGVPNRAPVAGDDSYTTDANVTLNVNAADGLLSNDSDPDSDPITVALQDGPAHGSLTVNTDGSFSYTPMTNYIGSDSFTYRALDNDSAASNLATVRIEVSPTAAALCALYPGGYSELTDGGWGCYGVLEADQGLFASVCPAPYTLTWELAQIGPGEVPSLSCRLQPV